MSKLDGYMSFMRDEAKVKQYWQRLVNEGSQTGIQFEFDGRMGDTFNAHRLAEWALDVGGPAAQDRLVEEQFSQYMEHGEPPCDRDSLLKAVEKVGLDSSEAARVLDSGAYANETREKISSASSGGIRGVPHFFIEGRSAGSGAMPTQEWVGMLRRVAS